MRVLPLLLATVCVLPAADFVTLNLRVVEGEGQVYGTGSRATRGIAVLVTDERGRPMPDVAVSFVLPPDGPSGVFASGNRNEVVTTRQDGQAVVWGMRWNKIAGTVEVKIMAMKEQVRAGVVSTQYLSDAPTVAHTSGLSRGGSHSKLWIAALAVAGAAGGGLAMGMSHGAAAPASVAPVTPLSIGRPNVIVGAP